MSTLGAIDYQSIDRITDGAVDAQVNVCHPDYCPRCACDAGGGDCSICRIVRDAWFITGRELCGGCGREIPRQPRICTG